jgi:raffinose/stachyose/melibiose transport system permease protein
VIPGRVGRAVRYLVAGLTTVIFLGPLLILLNTALKTRQQFAVDPAGITRHFDLGNFAAAWDQGAFRQLVLNSVLYAAVSAGVGTLLSLLVAFPIARHYIRSPRFWHGLFVIALFLPNALPTQFQLMLQLGLYDTRVGYLLLLTAPLGVGPLLIIGYVRSVPKELDEAAAIDGAGYFRYLFQFVVPLCRPVLITVFILEAITAWNEIIFATIFLPDADKLPVSAGLFGFYGQYGNQWPLLAAATLIVATPLVAVYLLLQRLFVADALRGAFRW